MTTYIGLLRAINLGPHNRVAMGELRDMCAAIGLDEAKTLLASGNLVFQSRIASSDKLEQALEAASTKHLGVTTDYFVRSAEEWKAIIKANPISERSDERSGHLLADVPARGTERGASRGAPGRDQGP
jgi:uncharacterized protein (DUF1697 family)